MKICMTWLVLLLSFSLWMDAKPPSPEEDSGSLLARFTGLLEERRAWARPIHSVDMERMRELKEMGLLTFHRASWAVEVDPDER